MLHVPASTFARRQTVQTVIPRALRADEYLTLRRKAAGLSVDQVAERLAPRLQDRSTTRDLVLLLETPGAKARNAQTLFRLRSVFRFDIAVYRQLMFDPAERHPRICRTCGCSQDDACVSADGHEACAWSSDTACTVCAGADA